MDLSRLTCQDVIAMLGEYLEYAVGSDLIAALERHLADCPPCLAYLNTYRQTRELTRQAGRVEMPEELRVRLRQLLLEHLARRPS